MKTPLIPRAGGSRRPFVRALVVLLVTLTASVSALVPATRAATITLLGSSAGPTPEIAGINLGHFAAGTNAPEFWRYFGARGVRVFVSPPVIELSDDITGTGDGVTDRDSFFARRADMDTHALDSSYINWTYFENKYANASFTGNTFKLDDAFTELRAQGTDILVCITASLGRFPIANDDDWAGKWELWQHFYAQAFYLAREYDVVRYAMFNEPNHPNAGGITAADWESRLELASDAIQRAVAEVNSRYSKSLVPVIFAPNTAGTTGTAWSDWGALAINYRHRKINGYNYSTWNNLQVYNYQYYGSSGHNDGSTFASQLDTLTSNVAGAMPSETPYPIAITEFNSLTAATFDSVVDSLDTPRRYAQLGSIAVELANHGIREMYAFKLAQTERTDSGSNYPVQKNGLCYTDNDSTSPSAWSYGGITLGGEAYRLFLAAASGDTRLNYSADSSLSDIDILVTKDTAANRYYIYLVNPTDTARSIDLNTSALGSLQDRRVTIREVSSTVYGGVVGYTRVNANVIASGTLPARSVRLVTLAAAPIETSPYTLSLNAAGGYTTEDAMVKDGGNKYSNYGTSSSLYAKNDASNANARNATFLKFTVPSTVDMSKVEFALLELQGSTLTASGVAQAMVYGCTDDTWSESTIDWDSAPGLAQSHSVGNRIRDGVATGLGTTLHMVGQITVNGPGTATLQIDATDFVRAQSDRVVTFVIIQDPRRDFTIDPAGPVGTTTTGDTQVDGLKFISKEGASAAGVTGPTLKLIRRL